MTNMIRADTLCVGPSNSEFTIFTMHQFREDGFNLIGIVWICCQEIEEVQPGMTHWASHATFHPEDVGSQDDNDVWPRLTTGRWIKISVG